METFTIGVGNRWRVRVLGRNPLVRRCDRIQALVLVLGAVLTVVAMPIAGAIGTSVYDSRTRLYAEDAQAKHQVIATAIEDGSVGVNGNKVVFTGVAMWSVAGQPHTGEVEWPSRPKTGAQQFLWIDAVSGRRRQWAPIATHYTVRYTPSTPGRAKARRGVRRGGRTAGSLTTPIVGLAC
jgi:hypothetical protein